MLYCNALNFHINSIQLPYKLRIYPTIFYTEIYYILYRDIIHIFLYRENTQDLKLQNLLTLFLNEKWLSGRQKTPQPLTFSWLHKTINYKVSYSLTSYVLYLLCFLKHPHVTKLWTDLIFDSWKSWQTFVMQEKYFTVSFFSIFHLRLQWTNRTAEWWRNLFHNSTWKLVRHIFTWKFNMSGLKQFLI